MITSWIIPYFFRASEKYEKDTVEDDKDSGISSDDTDDSDILDLLLEEDNNESAKNESKDTFDLSLSEHEKANIEKTDITVYDEKLKPVKKKRGPKNKLLYRMAYNKEGEYVKIYQCHLCEKEYKYQSGVSNHFRQVHKLKQ